MAEKSNKDKDEAPGKLGPWAEKGEDHRADKQQGDVHALDVEGDPRGGVQSESYRLGGPEDLVEEGEVAMMGPGGAVDEGMDAEERYRAQRHLDDGLDEG